MLVPLSPQSPPPHLPLIRNTGVHYGSSILLHRPPRNCGSLIHRRSLLKSIKCSSQGEGRRDDFGGGGRGEREGTEEFERLFSNLNQVTLKREQGSLSSAVFLVAGTTVGAGILAIPAVTQESGFLASSMTCIFCWLYMVVTGLLIAEVNVNTMCELGSGGVSLVSMAMRTLGKLGVQRSTFYCRWESALLFTSIFGSICYFGRTAIVLGTAIPLVLFLIWDAVILGTVPHLAANNSEILDPLQQLRSSNGLIGPVVELFSLLAIGTSYIGFVLGLSDFLSDLLKQPAGQNRPLPYLLTIFPPLVLALLDPEIFFRALDFAGTYGVLVLFGVLPAAMSWSERYNRASSSPCVPPLVPGGRLTLGLVSGGAAWVILSEILANFS
ncbi:unnamed protein product [Victoria cruziana]